MMITDAELDEMLVRAKFCGFFSDGYVAQVSQDIPRLVAEVRRLRDFSADFGPGNTVKFVSPIGGGTFKIKSRLGNEVHLVGVADDIDD